MLEVHDSKGTRLCLVWQKTDWKGGLQFLTEDHQFLQVGTWWYERGKTLDRHHHNIIERKSNLTQECVIIISGRMKVDIYDKKNSFVESFELFAGDLAIFEAGGHGYEILEDDTKIIETKNGPFMGIDLDKTRF